MKQKIKMYSFEISMKKSVKYRYTLGFVGKSFHLFIIGGRIGQDPSYYLSNTVHQIPFIKYHLSNTVHQIPFIKYHLHKKKI